MSRTIDVISITSCSLKYVSNGTNLKGFGRVLRSDGVSPPSTLEATPNLVIWFWMWLFLSLFCWLFRRISDFFCGFSPKVLILLFVSKNFWIRENAVTFPIWGLEEGVNREDREAVEGGVTQMEGRQASQHLMIWKTFWFYRNPMIEEMVSYLKITFGGLSFRSVEELRQRLGLVFTDLIQTHCQCLSRRHNQLERLSLFYRRLCRRVCCRVCRHFHRLDRRWRGRRRRRLWRHSRRQSVDD